MILYTTSVITEILFQEMQFALCGSKMKNVNLAFCISGSNQNSLEKFYGFSFDSIISSAAIHTYPLEAVLSAVVKQKSY